MTDGGSFKNCILVGIKLSWYIVVLVLALIVCKCNNLVHHQAYPLICPPKLQKFHVVMKYKLFAGNFDQAISCLEHQITLAKEQLDKTGESDACCGLGGVYQQMGDYERAINFHKKDLQIAQVSTTT